jgi:hypothetical protein
VVVKAARAVIGQRGLAPERTRGFWRQQQNNPPACLILYAINNRPTFPGTLISWPLRALYFSHPSIASFRTFLYLLSDFIIASLPHHGRI